MRRLVDGGCDFLVDPGLRADRAAVIWHPEDYDQVVVLTTAASTGAALRFAPTEWPGEIVRLDAIDGTHILVTHAGSRFQLWFPDAPSESAAMTALLRMDDSAANRTEAVLRFWLYLRQNPRPPPAPTTRSDRLVTTLRALDGHLDGATYREIAESLFDPKQVAAGPWKTSPWRDRIIRLVRQGRALMTGGYRHLLRRRHD